MAEYKPKSFWQKPEGKTGAVVLGAVVLGAGALIATSGLSLLASIAGGSIISITATLLALGAIIYMALDPKMRTLVSYMYKSAMRWITGLFITIDPIAILKNYVDDLKNNLRKMNQQIGKLRGQMHKLKELIHTNNQKIEDNLNLAGKAKQVNKRSQVVLKTRQAGRLRDSNVKLETLYKKMEVMYRVLTKMYENSEIMMFDIKDQVEIKEQEYIAIKASNSAMKSAMNIISGNKDKRAMFDMALEKVADDVSGKLGEMERFMDMSENFMESVDLQNGVFEEKGMKMLEKWEKEGISLILGDEKEDLVISGNDDNEILDINQPIATPERANNSNNQYDSFFD